MLSTVQSTAKRGNPRQASRGAGVQRAKSALSDALDVALELEIVAQERWRLEYLAGVVNVPVAEMRERLDLATIGELEGWVVKVKEASPRDGGNAARRL